MKIALRFLALMCVASGLVGCASTRQATIVARCRTPVALKPSDKLSVLLHPDPIPEEMGVDKALAAALDHAGYQIVDLAVADYAFGYWVEDNWKEMRGEPLEPRPVQVIQVLHNPVTGAVAVERPLPDVKPRGGPVYYRKRGIRLKLYPAASVRSGRFDVVWEGFVDAGQSVPADQQQMMIEILLQYLGRDFTGNVPLP